MMSREYKEINELSAEITKLHDSPVPSTVLPSSTALESARSRLHCTLPTTGAGFQETIRHLQEDLSPAFNASSRSARYYGFVTGGVTPAAAFADNLVTFHDQNVQVHLPNETIATEVEDRALTLLCELLDLVPSQWPHRTFTTGATASNVLGLACGREHILFDVSASHSKAENSVGEMGIVEAMRQADIDKIQILTTVPHSSLSKAASIIGLGRRSIKDVGQLSAPHKFDVELLCKHLSQPRTASILAISASEVNTGLFATSGLQEMRELRELCDKYGAWIHVDGAFGILGRVLTSAQYSNISESCAGLELADSITGDGHKLLNVPYDCGFFLCRHRNIAQRVFKNPNAAYLASGSSTDLVMSPLNVGIENSRRFRALPVYANLIAYGKQGYSDMLQRQIQLSRGIAKFILDSDDYELLPESTAATDDILSGIYIIVLFRAKDKALNDRLVETIKATRKLYVSGTSWGGMPACRFAVSNWRVDVDADLPIIMQVLQEVAQDTDSALDSV